ncbi:MAG: AraC family transcriptional regulator [Bacteroidota bacterium]
MKAQFQHLGFDTSTEAMQCFWVRSPMFGFHWHYHPELEITYVHQGQGIRMVGDNVGYFGPGDFVFMGSDLPHTWISDDDFNQRPEQMEVAVLQFSPTLFSKEWLGFSEMANLRRLLQNAKRGICFSEATRKKAAAMLTGITALEGMERFAQILCLLNFLGADKEFRLLASQSYIPPLNQAAEERLLTVCQYLHEHFTEPVKLDTVARLANMNTTSFCRFFRKSTGQSLMEYVTDLRIGKACNLLLDHRHFPIMDVAYQSGFSTQTLFNRSFLKKKGMTPRDFRKLSKVG